MIYTVIESPLGPVYLFSEENFLTGVYLQSQLPPLSVAEAENGISSLIQEAIQWVDDYFGGKKPDPAVLPLRPTGTAFQQKVWQMLLHIPYGTTVTYGQLANQFPESMSAQAIGQAVSRNPISIVIPCHRVMGSDNSLTGYAGGIENKVWLLRHEGLDVSKFQYPKKYRGK